MFRKADDLGWFPFLFYSPTWVGETYFRYSAPTHVKSSSDKLGEIGRIGSLALVVFSIVTFTGSVLLPMVIKSAERDNRPAFTPRPLPAMASFLTTLYKNKPELLTAWLVSHFIFAAAMSLTPFVQSLRFATILVAVCGIPWALASWAPFAFIGIEINRLASPAHPLTASTLAPSYRRLSIEPIQLTSRPVAIDIEDTDSPPSSPRSNRNILRLHHLDRNLDDESGQGGQTGETAGIYLGILNLFTTLPQFVGTFISMIVFAVFEPGLSKELTAGGSEGGGEGGIGIGHDMVDHSTRKRGINAISVCLFIGALSSLGAAWATWKFRAMR